MTDTELKALVMGSFQAEQDGDVEQGKTLLHPQFRMTEMNIGPNGALFRSLDAQQANALLTEAFKIKDRKYQFISVAVDADNQTVVVEFVESYSDPRTGQRYRTPLVAVCEVRDGKIYRTRHYTDDRLSDLHLPQSEIDHALR
jgi:ketosteroid isomerase-like protein